MKYQVQIYNPLDSNVDRLLITETEGTFTQDALNEWYAGAIEGVEVPEGQQLTLIPDDHAWFVTPPGEANATPGPNTNPAQPLAVNDPKKPKSFATGKLISAEEVRDIEKKRSLERRLVNIAAREEKKKIDQEFQSGQRAAEQAKADADSAAATA